MFFSEYLLERTTKVLLSPGKASDIITFPDLPEKYTNSSALNHNLLHSYFDCLSLPQDIMLIYYIDIMLMGSGEWEAATILDTLVTHLCVRRWGKNLTNFKDL